MLASVEIMVVVTLEEAMTMAADTITMTMEVVGAMIMVTLGEEETSEAEIMAGVVMPEEETVVVAVATEKRYRTYIQKLIFR